MRTIATMTADLAMAFVRHHKTEDLPSLISDIHGALADIEAEGKPPEPIMSITDAVQEDHLVCLKCGAKVTLLERHLKKAHGINPAQYRATYRLWAEYPMVPPDFSRKRSAIAKNHGLGRSGVSAEE